MFEFGVRLLCSTVGHYIYIYIYIYMHLTSFKKEFPAI